MVSRRKFLSGVAALAGSQAFAAAPAQSLFPTPRPGSLERVPRPVADLIAEANLSGRIGYAVADAATGEVLEVLNPLYPLPPASVTKAITTSYALERLGPSFRFRTQIVTDGTLSDGVLAGNLWFVGAGDPLFDTDALAAMVQGLVEAGLREVRGTVRFATGALPSIFQIDPGQLPHAGYNPAISAMNLNFNRVFFEWERGEGGYDLRMEARSETRRPRVRIARMALAEPAFPLYTYTNTDTHEAWTVSRGALGNGGGRWLPVRRTPEYMAEVFRGLARQAEIQLGDQAFTDDAPAGAQVLVEHVSEPLQDILRGMMRWSTNLTAEVVGLLATQAGGTRPEGLAQSGAAMAEWMTDRLGARNARFVDHSGLGVDSRLRPQDMTHALVAAGANGALRDLMRDVEMPEDPFPSLPPGPVSVVAKTGTLSFVSTLAGYAAVPGARDLAFSIFCADVDRRAAIPPEQRERPPGARAYNRRAKAFQQALVQRWALAYAPRIEG